MNNMLEDIQNMILEMTDLDQINSAIDEKIDTGTNPLDILDALNQALETVGNRYEEGVFFLSELIMAGYLASEISKKLKPLMKGIAQPSQGKLVIGTVKGDIHDIGKNIVIMMLDAAGFEVIDLGVDVSTEKFIEAVKTETPQILGLSALLTSTMNEVKPVIEALQEQGLRDKVKVVVGGRPITQEFVDEIGADGFAEDSIKAIQLIRDLIEK
jgi:5-methyltetrahydrofolate--homocysteine methyltransferase